MSSSDNDRCPTCFRTQWLVEVNEVIELMAMDYSRHKHTNNRLNGQHLPDAIAALSRQLQ